MTRHHSTLMCVFLFVAAAWTFFPALHNSFVNYDDPVYVTDDHQVRGGLTIGTMGWAWGAFVCGNWHPLTLLSHLLDCRIFGLNPWGHHLTSVLLHCLNTVLVFLVFRAMTAAPWRSFFVALLFGLHPLHVESVAWVSERKDVLSTLFFLLSLLAYISYVNNKPAAGGKARIRYVLSLAFFSLGLLSKPMVVTLPCILLLLDYWPLCRFRQSSSGKLVLEKALFFLLSTGSAIITVIAQKSECAIAGAGALPLVVRCENAVVSYARYLGKTFLPRDLSVFYPFRETLSTGTLIVSGILVFGISALALLGRRRSPYLVTGWFWFVVTLIPVIGLVQVGFQSMADRYAYIPLIGLFVLSVWGSYDLAKPVRSGFLILSIAGVFAVVACVVMTRLQIGCWKDSETLFRHAIAVTDDNFLAHNQLGLALEKKDGGIEEATYQFREAIQLKPDYAEARSNLGFVLSEMGRFDEAVGECREALRLKPTLAEAYCNLGIALYRANRSDEAIHRFQEALRLQPRMAEAHCDLGVALQSRGRLSEAIDEYREALRLKPDYAHAHYNLNVACRVRDSLGPFAPKTLFSKGNR